MLKVVSEWARPTIESKEPVCHIQVLTIPGRENSDNVGRRARNKRAGAPRTTKWQTSREAKASRTPLQVDLNILVFSSLDSQKLIGQVRIVAARRSVRRGFSSRMKMSLLRKHWMKTMSSSCAPTVGQSAST